MSNFWQKYAFDCRTVLHLYELEYFKPPIRKRTFELREKGDFRHWSLLSGPGCFIPVRHGGQVDVFATLENLQLISNIPEKDISNGAQIVYDIYAEMFYRLSRHSLRVMQQAHSDRFQEYRIRRAVADAHKKLHIKATDADYRVSEQEVKLRRYIHDIEIPENFACGSHGDKLE